LKHVLVAPFFFFFSTASIGHFMHARLLLKHVLVLHSSVPDFTLHLRSHRQRWLGLFA
jgi:hypothetical protein